MEKIKKVKATHIEEFFDVELSKMSSIEINDTVKTSLSVIDKFLKSGRKLGYIEMEEAIEKTPDLITNFFKIKTFIEEKLDNQKFKQRIDSFQAQAFFIRQPCNQSASYIPQISSPF